MKTTLTERIIHHTACASLRALGLFLLLPAIPVSADIWEPAGRGADSRRIRDIHFIDSHNAWMVGDYGMIRYTPDGGVTWQYQESGTSDTIMKVWGADLHHVWALKGTGGPSQIIKWDGSRWGIFPTPSEASSLSTIVYSIDGVSASEFWVQGEVVYSYSRSPTLWKWNGSAWETVVSPWLSTQPAWPIWASSSTTLWVGAFNNNERGRVARLSGAGWTYFPQNVNPVEAISGRGENDVTAVGAGFIRRWNGSSWNDETITTTYSTYFRDVWCEGGRVAITGPDIYEWDVTQQAWVREFGVSNNGILNAVDGWEAGLPNTNKIAAGSDGLIVRAEPTGWQEYERGVGSTKYLHDIWGENQNRVWVVGQEGIIRHWNGSVWQSQSSGTTQQLLGVWGVNGSNVWAVGGNGTILKHNGFTWQPQAAATTQTLYEVSGSGGDDVWVVGTAGTILHFTGNGWDAVPSGTTNDLYDVSALGANDAWAVGSGGLILRWNGTSWQHQVSGVTSHLLGVHAVDANHVWAVGVHGVILQWDGIAWNRQTAPAGFSGLNQNLNEVWGADPSHVWIAANGGILRWNGTFWSTDVGRNPLSGIMNSVWGASAADVLACDYGGCIFANTPVHDDLQAFRHNFFGITGNTGEAADEADPDGDGLANLAEYAMGFDPKVSSVAQLPQASREGSNWVMQFSVPSNQLGITYRAEWSTTLAPGSWTRINDSGTGTTHRFSVPIGTNKQLFMRLVFLVP